jgi:hypothetical protein
MEQWRDVLGFENIYQVSNFGNVRSIKSGLEKKITRPTKGDTRPFVNLHKDGKQKIMRIHKLVLEAFVSKCPEGLECCHNDGNSQNNHISNLRWDTHTSNIHDRIKHGTSNRGERCGTAKLTLQQVRAIRQDNRLQKIIAAEHGVRENTISRIKSGGIWKHDV